MGKIAFTLLTFHVFISCASWKNNKPKEKMAKDYEIFYEKRAEEREVLLELNDSYLESILRNSCFDDWGEKVYDIKDRLKKVTTKMKPKLWFELGNCYNYVGDFNKALFYYDLVENSGVKDTKILSIVYSNTGEIYSNKKHSDMAVSYFQKAYNLDDPTSLSLFKLGIYSSEWGMYRKSIRHFSELSKRYPKSNLIKYLIGIQYFLLGDEDFLKDKVLSRLDEKYIGAQLLKKALEVKKVNNKMKENFLSELEDLDSPISYFKNFQNLIRQKVKIEDGKV